MFLPWSSCVCLSKLLVPSTLLSLQVSWQNTARVLPNLFRTKPSQPAQNAPTRCCVAVLRQIRSVLFSWIFCRSSVLQQGSSEVCNRQAKWCCPSASRQFMQGGGDKGFMERWAPAKAQNALKLPWLLEQRDKGNNTEWRCGVISCGLIRRLRKCRWICLCASSEWAGEILHLWFSCPVHANGERISLLAPWAICLGCCPRYSMVDTGTWRMSLSQAHAFFWTSVPSARYWHCGIRCGICIFYSQSGFSWQWPLWLLSWQQVPLVCLLLKADWFGKLRQDNVWLSFGKSL